MILGRLKGYDLFLALLVSILVATSVAMIYSLTVERTAAELAIDQALFALIGLAVGIWLAAVDYRRLQLIALPSFLVGLVLLGIVLVAGTTVFGATRWIDLAGFQFQPAEPMKLVLIVFVAHLLASRPSDELRGITLVGIGLAIAVTLGLILLQPDLGTTGILALTSLALLGAARLPRAYWWSLIALVVVCSPILWANLRDYQVERIQTFLQPTSDPLGAGYNVIQSLIAVGNGGLLGQGFGQGTQSQLDFLPVVHTDFIFAGIAESVGFVGSALLILLFVGLLLRTLRIAHRAADRFGMFVALGIASLWFVQLTVNVGMTIGLAPVTGIPLPFVSYGGTALVTNLAAVGILESIALRSQSRRLVG